MDARCCCGFRGHPHPSESHDVPCCVRIPKSGGSIRIGPKCRKWLDPYEHLLTFEIEPNRVAVIGGLTWRISRADRDAVVAALVKLKYRPVMDRIKNGRPHRVDLVVPRNSP